MIVTADEHAKITDFGLSVYVAGVSRNYFSMRSGNVRWTAPELIVPSTLKDLRAKEEMDALRREEGKGDGHIVTGRPTMQSDIYAFACTCVEVRVNFLPSTSLSMAELSSRLLGDFLLITRLRTTLASFIL